MVYILKAFRAELSPQEPLKVKLSMKFQGVDFSISEIENRLVANVLTSYFCTILRKLRQLSVHKVCARKNIILVLAKLFLSISKKIVTRWLKESTKKIRHYLDINEGSHPFVEH